MMEEVMGINPIVTKRYDPDISNELDPTAVSALDENNFQAIQEIQKQAENVLEDFGGPDAEPVWLEIVEKRLKAIPRQPEENQTEGNKYRGIRANGEVTPIDTDKKEIQGLLGENPQVDLYDKKGNLIAKDLRLGKGIEAERMDKFDRAFRTLFLINEIMQRAFKNKKNEAEHCHREKTPNLAKDFFSSNKKPEKSDNAPKRTLLPFPKKLFLNTREKIARSQEQGIKNEKEQERVYEKIQHYVEVLLKHISTQIRKEEISKTQKDTTEILDQAREEHAIAKHPLNGHRVCIQKTLKGRIKQTYLSASLPVRPRDPRTSGEIHS